MLRKKKLSLLCLLLIIGLVGLTVFGIGIYKYHWRDQFVLQVAEIIPYPAALVNWHNVTYASWMSNVKDLEYFYGQAASANLTKTLTPEEIADQELDHLIEFALVEQIAKDQGIKITDQDIEQEFTDTIVPQAAGGVTEIEQTLQSMYGWDLAKFKQIIVREMVLRNQISAKVAEQADKQAAKKQQLEQIRQDIVAGKISFEQAATQYSEDSSASQGGDLGWFGRGEMVKNFEDAAFNLEPGQISEVLRTKFGYHLIKLEERKTEDGTEQIHARHILIRLYGVDDLIKEYQAKAKIHRFF